MIPIIGIMIGGYIILRCFDILSRAESSFSSSGARTRMLILAVLVIGATVLEIVSLMQSSQSVPRGMMP
jgi:hypothetical protein